MSSTQVTQRWSSSAQCGASSELQSPSLVHSTHSPATQLSEAGHGGEAPHAGLPEAPPDLPAPPSVEGLPLEPATLPPAPATGTSNSNRSSQDEAASSSSRVGDRTSQSSPSRRRASLAANPLG